MAHILLKGFKKFRQAAYGGRAAVMKKLTQEGQSPDYFIISCIDSRSNPATIFKSLPGTFFAFKAVGAIVRPYKRGTALSAALQFAVNYNKVQEIIVLGHTGCGAIKVMVEGTDDEEISSFIDIAHAGFEQAQKRCGNVCEHAEMLRYTEEEIVVLSRKNLQSYPCVAKALEEGRVVIRAWLFDMESGNLLEYADETQKFTPITQHA